MKNEDYMQAHMLPPSQNKLLLSKTDFVNYKLLCKFILRYKPKNAITILYHPHTSYRQLCEKESYEFKMLAKQTLTPWIIKKTPKLNNVSFKLRFSTRVYWIANGLNDFPKCNSQKCNNKIYNNVISFIQGYTKHCCIACVNQDKIVRDKIANTKYKLYGDAEFNNRPKNALTCSKKYGVLNGGGSKLAHNKIHRKYFYDNIYFDSAPELAFYIWLKDMNIEFEYQPNIPLQYTFNGKRYNYFVDFKLSDILIEIKGDHFFNDDGVLYCPFRKKSFTNEQYAKINERYKAKHQCMLENNVVIMRSTEYNMFLLYVSQKHGKDYLKQFRVDKHKEI